MRQVILNGWIILLSFCMGSITQPLGIWLTVSVHTRVYVWSHVVGGAIYIVFIGSTHSFPLFPEIRNGPRDQTVFTYPFQETRRLPAPRACLNCNPATTITGAILQYTILHVSFGLEITPISGPALHKESWEEKYFFLDHSVFWVVFWIVTDVVVLSLHDWIVMVKYCLVCLKRVPLLAAFIKTQNVRLSNLFILFIYFVLKSGFPA